MTTSGFNSRFLNLNSSPARPRNGGIRGSGVLSGREFGIYVIESKIKPDRRMQRGVEAGFGSGVACRSLIVFGNSQPVFNVARWRQKHEISDVVIEAVRFKPHALRRMSNSKIETVAEFTFEIRIADLKREITRVWSKVVQLFQSPARDKNESSWRRTRRRSRLQHECRPRRRNR